MPTFKYDGELLSAEAVAEMVAPYVLKFQWFLSNGYQPHYWQTIFHSMTNGDRLCRFRHLVAGRRGGKTLSAAWECVYYLLHPREWWWDFRQIESEEPIRVWALAKDHPTGLEALLTFRRVLDAAGLRPNIDYRENKGNKWFEFPNGGFIQFRTADDPQSLRGAGLNLLWMDEAAFIPSDEAYNVARPALSDKIGGVIGTTTPIGTNWYYDTFWEGKAADDPDIGRVEYTSIHNPYFPKSEWEYALKTYHPLLFKREYMAAFDAMAGRELSGEWLRYYTEKDIPRDPNNPRLYDLNIFIGVDPAVSLADGADQFAAAIIGVTKDNLQAYLLEIVAGHFSFPEQVELMSELHLKWRPQTIGIESNVYQQVFVQQTLRLPGFVPAIPMLSKGKKAERILAMAPLFRIGKIKIRETERDFINQWLNYDSTLKNPDDDILDAVEIALRSAGALLPALPEEGMIDFSEYPATSMEELVKRDLPKSPSSLQELDEHLGGEW